MVKSWYDRSPYVWNWWDGRTGTMKDKTMMEFSPLLQDILRGRYVIKKSEKYRIIAGGVERWVSYILAEGDIQYDQYLLYQSIQEIWAKRRSIINGRTELERTSSVFLEFVGPVKDTPVRRCAVG